MKKIEEKIADSSDKITNCCAKMDKTVSNMNKIFNTTLDQDTIGK